MAKGKVRQDERKDENNCDNGYICSDDRGHDVIYLPYPVRSERGIHSFRRYADLSGSRISAEALCICSCGYRRRACRSADRADVDAGDSDH